MGKTGNKAQGLPLNTIILAILVIIVLVVVVLIFTGKMSFFGKSLNNCDGTCVTMTSECPEDQMPIPISNCKNLGENYKYCCVKTK